MSNEINEKNEKIAQFMGYEPGKKINNLNGYFVHPVGDCFKSGTAKYHKSWDWLMPVVEKISITALVDIRIHKSGGCSIWVDGTLISGAYNGSTINQVYSCVHRFIDWYNENEVKG